MPTLSETLAWLVDTPSETGSEAQLRDAIADRLSSHPTTVVADSLVVGDPSPESVILAGHLDTVPLQGEPGSRVDGGRLFGLGATDMKGGLAVMIHLLEDLGSRSITGVFYAGEEGPLSENQLAGVLEAVPGLLEARAAVVLEPTDRAVEAGCQGVVNASVVFEGKASHSARPWFGVNAVTRAGDFLSMMDGLQPEPHVIGGLEFREVISVTRAMGGVANNVIPARFELNVNYRFAPDRTPEEAVSRLEDVCSGADDFMVTDLSPAALPHVDHPLFRDLAVAAGAEIAPKQSWTDVAQLTERGIPAVNFGPGEVSLAHKPGESVRLADLDWAYSALAEVLTS